MTSSGRSGARSRPSCRTDPSPLKRADEGPLTGATWQTSGPCELRARAPPPRCYRPPHRPKMASAGEDVSSPTQSPRRKSARRTTDAQVHDQPTPKRRKQKAARRLNPAVTEDDPEIILNLPPLPASRDASPQPSSRTTPDRPPSPDAASLMKALARALTMKEEQPSPPRR